VLIYIALQVASYSFTRISEAVKLLKVAIAVANLAILGNNTEDTAIEP